MRPQIWATATAEGSAQQAREGRKWNKNEMRNKQTRVCPRFQQKHNLVFASNLPESTFKVQFLSSVILTISLILRRMPARCSRGKAARVYAFNVDFTDRRHSGVYDLLSTPLFVDVCFWYLCPRQLFHTVASNRAPPVGPPGRVLFRTTHAREPPTSSPGSPQPSMWTIVGLTSRNVSPGIALLPLKRKTAPFQCEMSDARVFVQSLSRLYAMDAACGRCLAKSDGCSFGAGKRMRRRPRAHASRSWSTGGGGGGATAGYTT